MSRRHRRSVTSARRHLTTAIGFAALGSLSPTTIEVPLQSKDDEPYPRAFLGSFLWGTATAAYQVKGAWNEWQGRVDLEPVRAHPENREQRYRRSGPGPLLSVRGRTFSLSELSGQHPRTDTQFLMRGAAVAMGDASCTGGHWCLLITYTPR